MKNPFEDLPDTEPFDDPENPDMPLGPDARPPGWYDDDAAYYQAHKDDEDEWGDGEATHPIHP